MPAGESTIADASEGILNRERYEASRSRAHLWRCTCCEYSLRARVSTF